MSIPVALVLLLVIAPQAYAGYATNTARETADEVFVDAPAPLDRTVRGARAGPEQPRCGAGRVGGAVRLRIGVAGCRRSTPAVPRVTGLIIGVDPGVGRSTYLTDTMIVVSLDPVAETVSLVSIPRDMVDVPLSDGRKFRGKINSLVAYARNHPKQFPGSNGKGFDVLMDALGTLLKEPIQYYAKVDLGGFVKRRRHARRRQRQRRPQLLRLALLASTATRTASRSQRGRHHLNGHQALAYARVRKPAGESDFTRAARQQEVVQGIRDAIVRGGFLNDPVGLSRRSASTVETNVPRKKLPDLADAASHINRKSTYRAVITHPLVRGAYDSRGSIQKSRISATSAARPAAIFPPTGTLPPAKYLAPPSSGSVSGSGVSSCRPAATPSRNPSRPRSRRPSRPADGPPHATPVATPVETPVSTPPRPDGTFG